ncbi:54S ribosomal protein L2 mitochondrial [Xylographa opegraphella]|nr:54S ribosomal protein L2 mitochondrial [Xylographa opegraphella]
MLQPRLPSSIRSLRSAPSTASSLASSSLLLLALTRLSLYTPNAPQPPTHTPSRAASHASQGRANKAAPGPGKRLGAKKGDSELVVPGNIIFRQRGTHWFAGENCGMGRDHTIFALQKGFVRYYRDPDRHASRKYIGVVFERGMQLPRGRGGARWRRLGLEERERESAGERESVGEGDGMGEDAKEGVGAVVLREGYQYRESNWSIGRSAERAGVKVRPYKPNDRWLAWRKTSERKARNAEKRSLRRKK